MPRFSLANTPRNKSLTWACILTASYCSWALHMTRLMAAHWPPLNFTIIGTAHVQSVHTRTHLRIITLGRCTCVLSNHCWSYCVEFTGSWNTGWYTQLAMVHSSQREQAIIVSLIVSLLVCLLLQSLRKTRCARCSMNQSDGIYNNYSMVARDIWQ